MEEFGEAVESVLPVVRALVMSSGDTLVMRPPDQRAIATQLVEGGLRMVPDLATHAWDGADGLGVSAVWAPVGERVLDEAVPDVSGLSLRQKAELFEQLQAQGFGGPPPPPKVEGAEVEQ